MKKVLFFVFISSAVHAQTVYKKSYDSLDKNDSVVTNITFEGLAMTGDVNNAVSSKVPTNRTITVNGNTGTLTTNLFFDVAGGSGVTLSGAYSNGNFVGTERITPLAVDSERFGITAGDNATGLRNYSFGYQAGRNVISTNTTSIGSGSGNLVYGINWTAVGHVCADHVTGNDWTAVGGYSGNWAIGNLWCSFGYRSGSYSTWSNSVAVGNYAGYYVQGKGIMCIDTYTSTPPYTLNFGTNDAILIRDGITHIGRTGSKTNSSSNVLRGRWNLNESGIATQADIESRVEKSNGTATNLSVFSSLTLLDKTITWNTSRQTFDVPLYGGVEGQLFQENLMLVRNQTGANIGNGKIVCSAGAVGDNSAIRKASSSDASCAWGVLGMVTQDAGIDHGSDGLICTGGEVNNLPLPTSVYQPSNTLWLATDGNYTNVEPQNVAVKYQIGTVLRAHATEGRIQFNPQFIPSPETLGALPTSHNTDETAHPGIRSIVKPIVFGTNVVRVVSTQSVYVATVTSPCVITQDVSALTLATNQTAFWTTRINVTDWSATNGITFATNIVAYAGGFTVTGCYDFACSLLCDGRIEMRQTFPTVYPWAKSPTSAPGVNTTYDICTFERKTILGASDLSKTIVAEIPCVTCPYIVRTLFYAGSPSAWATNVSISAGLVWFGNLEYGSALYTTNSISTNAIAFKITQHYVPSISLQPTTSARLYFNVSRPGLAGGFTFHPVEYRQANENEIRAYNNGWRPQ